MPLELQVRFVKSYLQSELRLLPEPTIAVDVSELNIRKCESCGRSKAEPASRGCFPRIIEGELDVIAKTKNYFGSGAEAFNEIIIGSELVRKLHESGIKGMGLVPVQSD